MTLGDELSIKALIEQGNNHLLAMSDSAKLDAELLLCFVINKNRSYLLTWPEKLIEPILISQYVELLNRRFQGEPIAYILGQKEFWSLPFYVSPSTLIPRPDTETLVELVLEQCSSHKELSCLDLGTGTGAIALALASEKSLWQIDAVDFNNEAVALAKKNAKHLKFNQVNIYQSDWFNSLPSDKKFDIIVSNPPYIDDKDEHIGQGELRFEPLSALVASKEGLGDIEHISQSARHYLKEGGMLFFEHGFEQGTLVRDLLLLHGYKSPLTVKDLNGQDRITWAVK